MTFVLRESAPAEALRSLERAAALVVGPSLAAAVTPAGVASLTPQELMKKLNISLDHIYCEKCGRENPRLFPQSNYTTASQLALCGIRSCLRKTTSAVQFN